MLNIYKRWNPSYSNFCCLYCKPLRVRGAYLWQPEVQIFKSQRNLSLNSRSAYLWEPEVHIFESPKFSCAFFSLKLCQHCWETSIYCESNVFWYACFFPSFVWKRQNDLYFFYGRFQHTTCNQNKNVVDYVVDDSNNFWMRYCDKKLAWPAYLWRFV